MITSAISLIVVIFVIEIIYRKQLLAAEYARKLSHVLCGFLVWFLNRRLSLWEYSILLALFLIFFLAERSYKLLRSLHDIGRPSMGILAYIAGLYLLGISHYSSDKFNLGLMLMIVPDAVAGAVTYTRNVTYKDWLHSTVVFYSCLIISVFVLPFIDALVLSFMIALTERYSPYGLDNLTIPAVYVLLNNIS
jgi:phytol kinase